MRQMVVGLVTNAEQTKICLIQKIKPDYLKGFWNGPGGKVEEGESPHEAMIRELKEETGMEAPGLTMNDAIIEMRCSRDGEEDWLIWFFDIRLIHFVPMQMEEERVVSFPISRAIAMPLLPSHARLVPNFYWIIPFLLDPHRSTGWRLLASERWPKR